MTLAGARRRLEEELTPVAANAPALDELIGRNARERLTEVKRGLRSILDLLGGRPAAAPRRMVTAPARGKVTRGKAKSSRKARTRG